MEKIIYGANTSQIHKRRNQKKEDVVVAPVVEKSPEPQEQSEVSPESTEEASDKPKKKQPKFPNALKELSEETTKDQ